MGFEDSRPGPIGPESRFSANSHLCIDTSWWSSTDDHSTEIEVSEMIGGMVRGLQPRYCIETGSAWGQTAEAIGKALVKNKHGKLDSIELDPERIEYSRNRCMGVGFAVQTMPVEFHEMSSMEFTPTETIDFAFFDSLFPLRVPEFLRYRPWMRNGTIVAFHDTHPGHGGGQFPEYHMDLRTTIETELRGHINFIHMPSPRGITIGQVYA